MSDSIGSASTEADDQEEPDVYRDVYRQRQQWTDDDWTRWGERNPGRRDVGPDFDRIVGENIQRFRTAVGLTQADLAAALSAEGDLIHQQTIQKIEKGLRPLKYSEAVRIANALNISPTQLADIGSRATLNADFLKAITATTATRTELQSTAERLASSLGELANRLGQVNIDRPTSKPDAHLVEEAEGLVKTNWGRHFNEWIGEALRKDFPTIRVLEDVDAPTAMLQNLIAATAKAVQDLMDLTQAPTDGGPLPPPTHESRRDESDS